MQAARGNRQPGQHARVFPSIGTQIMNAGKAAGRVMVAVIQGRSMIVPPEVRAEREAICATCPENLEGRCRKCGCGVKSQFIRKTHIATEECPLPEPKWGQWII